MGFILIYSVVTLAYPVYNLGEEITFKLMKRDRGSLLPIPVEECNRKPITGLLSLTETEIDITYSKLLLAKPEDVLSIIKMEKLELESQLADNEGCPEVCFIEQAMELLKEREAFVKNALKEPVNEEIQKKHIINDLVNDFNSSILLHNDEDHVRKVRYESVCSDGGTASEEDFPNVAPEDLEISHNTATKPFYFYQGKYFKW